MAEPSQILTIIAAIAEEVKADHWAQGDHDGSVIGNAFDDFAEKLRNAAIAAKMSEGSWP